MRKNYLRITAVLLLIVLVLLLLRSCPENSGESGKKAPAVNRTAAKSGTESQSDSAADFRTQSSTTQSDKPEPTFEKKNDAQAALPIKKNNSVAESKGVQVIETPCDWQVTEGQQQPKPKSSRFHDFFISFYRELFAKRNLKPDQGKNIICLLDPRDPESMKVMTEIGRMAKNQELPPVFCIFNYDTYEHMVFDFFKQAKCNFPTTVTDSLGVCEYFDTGCKLPAVFYLWNGNVMNLFGGPKGKPFTPEALKKACCAPYVTGK